MTTTYLFKNLQPVSLAEADQAQRSILDHAKAQVGFLPNMYRTMANVPAVLESYLQGYDLFRQQSNLTPTEQEVVFLAISQRNNCHYCVAAHSTIAANQSGVPKDVLAAIRSGEPINDERLAALYAMSVELNDSRGRPDQSIVERFIQAGFTEKHLLSLVLAISVKVLSNYSNHLFDTEVDQMFSAYKV